MLFYINGTAEKNIYSSVVSTKMCTKYSLRLKQLCNLDVF